MLEAQLFILPQQFCHFHPQKSTPQHNHKWTLFHFHCFPRHIRYIGFGKSRYSNNSIESKNTMAARKSMHAKYAFVSQSSTGTSFRGIRKEGNRLPQFHQVIERTVAEKRNGRRGEHQESTMEITGYFLFFSIKTTPKFEVANSFGKDFSNGRPFRQCPTCFSKSKKGNNRKTLTYSKSIKRKISPIFFS